jgi:DNA-binding MarR family transcriptional regulator
MNAPKNQPDGVKAWELLLRTQAAVVAALSAEVEEATGLPLSWYDVLLELNGAPGRRLRMSDLGERVVLSRSRVSRIVDEMTASGLLERHADPLDGRATLAGMTEAGRSALRRAAPVYLDGIRRHFSSHLTGREIGTMAAALGRILRAVPPAP